MIFSIIIPIYNKSNSTILRTLVSIFAQKYPIENYEVIVIVDGEPLSKYQTIFGQMIKMGLPLSYYQCDNEGLGSPVYALNFGIKKAKAPFIIINGADIMHLNTVLESFEFLFLNQRDSKYSSCSLYPEFSNPAVHHGFDDDVFKNDLKQEENLYVATVWRTKYKDKFETIFGMDNSNDNWIKLIAKDHLLKYITDKIEFHPVMNQLIGDQKRIGYPFLVAAKIDLFYEMGGFNENYYRMGWDDFEWWIRSLCFAKTVHVHNIHGFHQWHMPNKHAKESDDLNQYAGCLFLDNYVNKGFIRPSSNLGHPWGEYERVEKKTKEEITSPNMFFEILK